MLTLDLYNNTALAGTPRSTTTNEFAINLADPHTSSELYGTVDRGAVSDHRIRKTQPAHPFHACHWGACSGAGPR